MSLWLRPIAGQVYDWVVAHGPRGRHFEDIFKRGVRALMDAVLEPFPVDEETEEAPEQGVRVAVIGRPNVGKSTLINRMIGEERLVAYDLPGTTRDAVEVPFDADVLEHAGHGADVRCDLQHVPPIGSHNPPVRDRRLDPQAEKTEAGFGQNGRRDADGGRDQHRGQGVGVGRRRWYRKGRQGESNMGGAAKKLGIGCGIGCGVVLLVLGGIGTCGYMGVRKIVDRAEITRLGEGLRALEAILGLRAERLLQHRAKLMPHGPVAGPRIGYRVAQDALVQAFAVGRLFHP